MSACSVVPHRSHGSAGKAGAVHSAAVSRAGVVALLAERRAALVAELGTTFFEGVNGRLAGLRRASDGRGGRLASLGDGAEALHRRLAEVGADCVALQACGGGLGWRKWRGETGGVACAFWVYLGGLEALNHRRLFPCCCRRFLGRVLSRPRRCWTVHIAAWSLDLVPGRGRGLWSLAFTGVNVGICCSGRPGGGGSWGAWTGHSGCMGIAPPRWLPGEGCADR